MDSKKFTANKNVETTVNGETLKTNSYTLELTEEETLDILISVLETLKNDDTTLDLIVEKTEKSNVKDSFEQSMNYGSSYSSYYNTSSNTETVTFDKQYLKDKIQELINDLEDSKLNAKDENKLNLTIYSYKGQTVKFELELSDSQNSQTATIEITKNKDSNNIISITKDKMQVAKIEYTLTKENGSKKLTGNASIQYESSTIPVKFNIESSKNLTKSNINVTFPSEDIFGAYEEDFTEDVIIELNSEISGELGKGTNNSTTYLSITSGETSAKFNVKEDITYTDDITIDDLNSENGICLNTMSVSELEKESVVIIKNFRKILPKKLELLGINSSTASTNDEEETTTIDDAENKQQDSTVKSTDNSEETYTNELEDYSKPSNYSDTPTIVTSF